MRSRTRKVRKSSRQSSRRHRIPEPDVRLDKTTADVYIGGVKHTDAHTSIQNGFIIVERDIYHRYWDLKHMKPEARPVITFNDAEQSIHIGQHLIVIKSNMKYIKAKAMLALWSRK